ncbi:MAG: hypothetical protein ACYCV6_03815 [Steroidobacteraceae bacterium]
MLRFLSSLFNANKPPRVLTDAHRARLLAFMQDENIPRYDPKAAPRAQDHKRAGDVLNVVAVMKVLLDRATSRAFPAGCPVENAEVVVMSMVVAGAIGRGLRRVFGDQLVVGDAITELFMDLCDWIEVPEHKRAAFSSSVASTSDVFVKIPGASVYAQDIEAATARAVSENLAYQAEAAVEAMVGCFKVMVKMSAPATAR